MPVPAAAIAKKAVAAVAGKILGGAAKGDGEGGGLVGIVLVAASFLLVVAFAIAAAPTVLFGMAADAAKGLLGIEQPDGRFALNDDDGAIKVRAVRHYVKEAERLERYAREKWPGDESMYSTPNWRWIYALDAAYSDNDYALVEQNLGSYEKMHERMLKATRRIRVDYAVERSASEPEESESGGWEFDEDSGEWIRTVEVTHTYWQVSYRSYKEIFRSGSASGAQGALADEMKYFAQFECGEYGIGWGDNGNALGYYQFDRRYGLAEFLGYCMDEHPGLFDQFEPWAGNGVPAQGDMGLEAAWILAFEEHPAEFASCQDEWAYESYYIAAQDNAAAVGIDLSTRRDCVKGLFWGITNLFGAGGSMTLYEDSGIDDSMDDRRLVETLCGYIVSHAPGNYAYGEAYARRYQAELDTVLYYLDSEPGQPGSSTPGADPAFGGNFSASDRAEFVGNYYRALACIDYDERTGGAYYDSDRLNKWMTDGPAAQNGVEGWVYYCQSDPQWQVAGGVIGSGATIGNSGCAITCMAMIWATYGGDDSIDPVTMLSIGRAKGVLTADNLAMPQNLPEASKEFGLAGEFVDAPESDDWRRVEEAVEAGGCAMASLSTDGGSGYFATSSHFVVVVGFSDDRETVHLADPAGRAFSWEGVVDEGESKVEIGYEDFKRWCNPGVGTHSRNLVILWPN